MEFRLLGPLEVAHDGELLALPAGKPRALLAALLVAANRVVSTDRLIDDLWGLDPPETAVNTLQVHVSQLRKALARAGAGAGRQIIVTRVPGYMLRLDPEELDVARFERLLAAGRTALARSQPAEAAQLLGEALSLWRGPPLAEFAGETFARPEIARLEEARLGALEDRFEAELELGRHTALLPELEATVAGHRLRERLRRQLMLALYRSGRQAEALAVYQRTRRELVDELGIEPGPTLQQLEKAILLHDPALELAESQLPPAAAAVGETRRDVRKLVSVVVADVAANTDLDPETERRAIDWWFKTALELVRAHGGRAERLPGDLLLGLFGVPTVHEDDALRALQAAAAVCERSRTSGGEHELEVRVGVSSGEMLDRDLDATPVDVGGAIVREAARLGRAAAAGDVVIADSTRRLAPDAIRVERLGEEASPPTAWRLTELLRGVPAFRRRLETKLVGRVQELGWLRHGFERAVRERQAQLLTVLGPAGIGKSRLVLELSRELQHEARVLTGRCLSYGTGITYWPLAEILRQLWDGDARAQIAPLLGGGEAAEHAAARLAAAVGLDGGAGEAEEVAAAVRKLVEALAREEPLLVVFDDIHWAEPTFLDLVEHLRDWTRNSRVAFVCLARPELMEARPSLAAARSNAGSLFLTRLSDAEAVALIDTIAAGRELTDGERERITDAAEGNPLFIEQMLAMLLDPSRSSPAIAVPPTIQALLAARLDALGWHERVLLELAAVIGQEFPVAAVEALAPDALRADCASLLQALLDKELLRAGGLEQTGEEAMHFRHILIRDAAYDSIPKERRAELHEQVGTWMEGRFRGRSGEYEEILGYHFEQAHRYRSELNLRGRGASALATKGGTYLASAGSRAYAIGDLPAARSLLGRAAALLPVDEPHRLALLADLGDALRESGDFERAGAVLLEAVERARSSGHVAAECHALAVHARMRLQVDTSTSTNAVLAEVDRAIEVFERLGDERGLARAWVVRAWVPWFRCRAAAAEAALEQAIEHAARAGDARTEAQSLNLVVGAAVFGPSPVDDAIRRCRQILERYPERRRVTASALRALGALVAMQGRFDEARDLLARDKEILRDLGLTVTLAVAGEPAAMVELLADQPENAERELREGYEMLAELGERSSFSTFAALLAKAFYMQGKYDEALEMTDRSERAAAADDVSTHVQWRGPRAKILARRGRIKRAEQIAREAVRLAEGTDFLNLHGDALIDLAEILRIDRRRAEAAAAVANAVTVYETKGNVVSAARARVSLQALRAGLDSAADGIATTA